MLFLVGLNPFLINLSFDLSFKKTNVFSGDTVYIIKMASQITALSEGFKTLRASKRTLACVLAEMVS